MNTTIASRARRLRLVFVAFDALAPEQERHGQRNGRRCHWEYLRRSCVVVASATVLKCVLGLGGQ